MPQFKAEYHIKDADTLLDLPLNKRKPLVTIDLLNNIDEEGLLMKKHKRIAIDLTSDDDDGASKQ